MEEKFVIFLNGVYTKDAEKLKKYILNRTIISVDGGTNFCYDNKIMPKYIIGDLDSIDEKVLDYYNSKCKIIKTDKDKDYTDFELAIKLIENLSFNDLKTRFKEESIQVTNTNKDVLVLGATGKRVDMTLSNLKKLNNSPNMKILSEEFESISYLKLENEEKKFKNLENKLFSIIPITDLKELTLVGFEYNLDKVNINKSIGLASNIVKNKEAIIHCIEGEMYIIHE